MTQDCWNTIGVGGDRSCVELETYKHCQNCPIQSAAGRQLLERDVPLGYLKQQTALLSQPKEEKIVGTIALTIFRLGKEWFALPTSLFQEVTELSPIHTLPHRSNEILLGIVSLRGEIQLCVSLTKLLELDTTSPADKISPIVYQRMVVVAKNGSCWVFPVDEILGVYRIPPEEFENVPLTVSQVTQTYTQAVVSLKGKRISYLNENLLFRALDRLL